MSNGFDVDALFKFSVKALEQLAEEHSDEIFYAFTIDDGLLCMNSEEQYQATLRKYGQNSPEYYIEAEYEKKYCPLRLESPEYYGRLFPLASTTAHLSFDELFERFMNETATLTPLEARFSVRYNSGDWEYQGFATLVKSEGYDKDLAMDAYNIVMDHPKLSTEEQIQLYKDSAYYKAMLALINRLEASGVFNRFNCSDNFKTFISRHNY
jgi:hypothetical protein